MANAVLRTTLKKRIAWSVVAVWGMALLLACAELTVLALATRRELLLVLIGGVFVLEGLSVVLQISWFKLTRRRLFRIAPIHHHFQFGGLHESQITVRFWIVGAVFSLLSLALTTGG